MPQTAKAQNLHPKMLPFQIFQHANNSKSSKSTFQNARFPNLPRCLKQQNLKTYIPKCCLSKSSKMPQTAEAQNLHPKMLPFQIFQDASNSNSSKPTSQNVAFPNFQDASNSKSSKPTSIIVPFSNLPRCRKQQKLKTYIPKCCLSKSSNTPQTVTAQNLHPKMMPFQIFKDASNSKSSKPTSQSVVFSNLQRCHKQQKLKTYIPTCCPFQIFQDASNSKSSKPTSQNDALSNLLRCLKQQKLQNLHPKMLPSQILQDASNSKSSKPTSQNVAFPNLPTCHKQPKLKTYIPLAIPNLPRCLKQQNLKTYIPKCCLSKSFKMPQTAEAQNLHSKMLAFQIFQDASNSKTSKPTSQSVAFPNLPRCLKQQKLKTYIPTCCLSKSSNMPTTAKAHKPTSQNVAFPNLPTCLKQQKLNIYIPKCSLSKSSKMPQTAKPQNLHPKLLPSQIFKDASNSKSSKPTSQNVAIPNLATCQQQQKLKNLHPKMLPFQIFQDASNSKSLKPTSQIVAFPNLPRCLKQQNLSRCLEQQKLKTHIPKRCLSKSSHMPKTAKAQNVAVPNLPRCLKQQKLKIYLPKWCLSKSSNMPQTVTAQNLHPKMLP